MRTIGVAQRALDLTIERVTDPSRKTFGKHLYEHGAFSRCLLSIYLIVCHPGTVVSEIARSRAEIDGARLLVLSAAYQVIIHLRPSDKSLNGTL